MSVFIVTATHTDDDYKRPDVSSETAMATSREDAIVRAVEFYLDRLDNGYAFDFPQPIRVQQGNRTAPEEPKDSILGTLRLLREQSRGNVYW